MGMFLDSTSILVIAMPIALPLIVAPGTPVIGRDVVIWFGILTVVAVEHLRMAGPAVPEALLRRLYDLVRLGPTSTNCAPARFVFGRGAEARARLIPGLREGNRA